MKLHNTLSKKISEIKPLEGNSFRIYSCGPTVYDYAHIGNLRTFVFSDTLKRTLIANGHKVQHVMNLTDIDDKTIKRSQKMYQQLQPKTALNKLTRFYEKEFMQNLSVIGNIVDDMEFVRATEMIPEMQVLISTLLDNNFAYIAEDGIYFSIEKYIQDGKVYGQLSNIVTENPSRHRIVNDEYDKDSVNDFVLWKLTKKGEPSWDFHINNKNLAGRPGWHIECSAMSSSQLGQPFDIHTGGEDLIFPHHENEIAQSTAGRDDPLYANVFFHSKHLLVDGKKMSKSLGNFFVLSDIMQKNFDPLAFRLFVLQAHYNNQSNFTWANLESAQNRLDRWRKLTDLRWQSKITATSISNKILIAMTDNLNTPKALNLIDEYFNDIESRLISPDESTLKSIKDTLGISLYRDDISPEQKQLIQQRDIARQNHNYTESDKIRNILNLQGIDLIDYNEITFWNKI